ncbi:MAG: hypothetical protein HY711_00920, partial [Candidatus Melainabacteria bacterium]|nr:hypothetical protein [Candidatus Melainabacteria bacterium]
MNWTRREVLLGLGATLCTAIFSKSLTIKVFAQQRTAKKGDILVVIFLRGGCDGLNLLAPVDDKNYIEARGTYTRITDKGNNKGLPLRNALYAGEFRIHAKAAGLKELYDSKVLAVVHACGLKNGTRSHFEAQSLIERGVSEKSTSSVHSGWITRHLHGLKLDGALPAVALGASAPESLLSDVNAISISDVNGFILETYSNYGPIQQAALRKFYSEDSTLMQAGLNTLNALDYVDSKIAKAADGTPLPYKSQSNARYPINTTYDLASSLQMVAQLIKMDVGVQV